MHSVRSTTAVVVVANGNADDDLSKQRATSRDHKFFLRRLVSVNIRR